MGNPWEQIDLETYERHMQLQSVFQLQVLNAVMRDQLCRCPAETAMILGVAGGNGLEHVDPKKLRTVYGVDVNAAYLEACTARYPQLNGIFEPLLCDLLDPESRLPEADLLIADLFIEYVGCTCFCRAVRQVRPQYVSCVIQINTDDSFVSDSPYLHAFDRLDEVHRSIDRNSLTAALRDVGYAPVDEAEAPLPNGKRLLRLDYVNQNLK